MELGRVLDKYLRYASALMAVREEAGGFLGVPQGDGNFAGGARGLNCRRFAGFKKRMEQRSRRLARREARRGNSGRVVSLIRRGHCVNLLTG
jgi:hypothetical protein